MKAFQAIAIGMLLLISGAVSAQGSDGTLSGSAPQWGPAGYTEVRYYYLPGIQAYYDIYSSMFIYYSGGMWVHRTNLSGFYRNYDLYTQYKVVLTDYYDETPYINFNQHKKLYPPNYSGELQKTIGNCPPGKAPQREYNYQKFINQKVV